VPHVQKHNLDQVVRPEVITRHVTYQLLWTKYRCLIIFFVVACVLLLLFRFVIYYVHYKIMLKTTVLKFNLFI